MFQISKVFTACCSHVLTKVPEGHPCGRLHGHNYEFEFVLAADNLDERGFVVDYRDLDSAKKFIDERLDHRHLNEVLAPALNKLVLEPTAENIARGFFEYFGTNEPWGKFLVAVRVRETPKTLAEFRP